MPANNLPAYTKVAKNGFSVGITAAQNTYDGAGANDTLIYTADSTNGAFVVKVRLSAKGSNVQSVARFYINNGLANTTPANNVFIGEITLPATAASAVSATQAVEFPIGFPLDPAHRIYMGLGTAVAAGWTPFVQAGSY